MFCKKYFNCNFQLAAYIPFRMVLKVSFQFIVSIFQDLILYCKLCNTCTCVFRAYSRQPIRISIEKFIIPDIGDPSCNSYSSIPMLSFVWFVLNSNFLLRTAISDSSFSYSFQKYINSLCAC